MKPTKITATLAILCGTCLIANAEAKPDKPHKKGPPPEIIKKFDQDGDGKLSDSERKAMREEMAKRREARIQEFDVDGDGKLSKEERQKMREARKAEWIKKYDTDGDGKISEEERKAIPKHFRSHKGNKGNKGKHAAEDKKAKKQPTAVE